MNAIEVESLSKKFKITHNKEETLKGFFVRVLKGGRFQKEEFWALKNVSFRIQKGESLGIIGSNGSGKTTMLRALAGILTPDSGKIVVNGKISTLFELGTGFHPDLSGRENVYLNGSILGLTKKEIDQKFAKIVEFSGLGEFIDTPLKFYSSGMQVRLAFSVAININPEIFLVDEVLAVGDAAFQEKSFAVMKEFKDKKATFVIVSHDLGTIQEFCDRVIYLREGKVKFIGRAEEAVKRYLEDAGSVSSRKTQTAKALPRNSDSTAVLTGAKFLDKEGKDKAVFNTGEHLTIRIFYEAKKPVQYPVFGLAIYKSDGVQITGPNTKTSKYQIDKIEGKGHLDYKIEKLPLLAGKYFLTVGLFSYNQDSAFDFIERLGSFQVSTSNVNQYGLIRFDESWELYG